MYSALIAALPAINLQPYFVFIVWMYVPRAVVLICFGCEYQCNQLPEKTLLRNVLLCLAHTPCLYC